jgi:hypothetical protein
LHLTAIIGIVLFTAIAVMIKLILGREVAVAESAEEPPILPTLTEADCAA